jgi:hypothetical protein
MRICRAIIVALLIAIMPLSARAQDGASLPRVLIIGDSTYSQHTRDLQKLLKDKVEVVYAIWQPGEIADTATAIQLLDRHLGRIDRNGNPVEQDKWPTWDLIHFNCGLGDLIHRAPGIKTFRVMPIHVGGVRNTPEDQYANNLDTLVKTLKVKAPMAKLVWASTTPIRVSASNVFEKGSEIDYNRVAVEVMKKHGVPINDMHTFVKHLINMDKPAGFGADPFHFDKKPIHMPIVRVIEQMFQLPPTPETEEEKTSKQNSAKRDVRS